MDWIKNRIKEPSSWAATGSIVIGVGVLMGQPLMLMVGIAANVVGLLRKDFGS
jgi:hypothetical protein